MKKLTFCCNCNKVFEKEHNIYQYDIDDFIHTVTCPHASYWLIISYNTKMFDDNYNKDMDWNEFLINGMEIDTNGNIIEKVYLKYEGYDKEHTNQLHVKYISQPADVPIPKVGELKDDWIVVTKVSILTKKEFYSK